MRIAVDAMGGDHAPQEILLGAKSALGLLTKEDELHIYGPLERVQAECARHGIADPRIHFIHCSQTIEMDDSPVEALKQKQDSAINKMAQDAGRGILDVIISAGNTGAFAAACQLRIKRIPGVSRPGIAVVMPTFHGPVVICDVGANVNPKSHHLHEYARMCTVFARAILKIDKPKIGLVSVGEEEAKGNQLTKDAFNLIKSDPSLNFVGNVEGRDIFSGVGNVFVCDGFVGNVVLKLTEALAEGLFKTIMHEIQEDSPQLLAQFKPVMDRIWKRHDFAEYGGAPLLGVNSVAIICHGRSDARAIYNAVRHGAELHRGRLNAVIADQLATGSGEPA